ncbi:MAG: tRNA pseudouridine(55) synthase [Caldisphaera sp.]|jgi:tRNA pseudouridine synthase 10|nr:MAG: hypothetical protein C0201_04890 [Caldisphaera sp.]
MSISETSLGILKKYPLCNRCLGRLFAKLGYAWSNEERGESIKKIILMEYHRKIRDGDENALNEFKLIAKNMGKVSEEIYKLYFKDNLEPNNCIICNGKLNDFINTASLKIIEELNRMKVKNFLIGVRVDPKVLEMEDKIRSEFKLEYGESIKNEIKREIGKKIQSSSQFKVDFSKPDIVVEVAFPKLSIRNQIRSLIALGTYKKIVRGESIKKSDAEKKLINIIANKFNAEDIILYSIARDEKDTRVIGEGIHLIMEIKRAKERNIDLPTTFTNKGLIITIESLNEKYKSYLDNKEKIMNRIYRCLIYCENDVSEDNINIINQIRNKMIEQNFNGKKRLGTLREIKCNKISNNLIECLILIDEQIYIKELINGNKSLSSISFLLNNNCSCIESDLLSSSPF